MNVASKVHEPAFTVAPSAAPVSGSEAVAALIAVSALVRLAIASALDLTDTEAYYASWARFLDASYYDHPPLIAWTTWVITRVIRAPWAVRLGPIANAVESAAYFQLGALDRRPERAKFSFKRFHVAATIRAQVHQNPRTVWITFVRVPPSICSRVHCDAQARLVPLRNAPNLERDFFDRVDPIFRIQPRMGRPAPGNQFDLAHALAAGFHSAVESGSRLKDKNCVAAHGFALNHGA